MKILIISATTGEGHNSFSKAIKDYYQIHNKDIDVKIVDLYKPNHKLTAFFVNEVSFFFLRHFPSFSVRNYARQIKHPINKNHNSSLSFGLIAKNTILNEIKQYKPDLIFTVHTYSTALINYLRRKNIIDIPHYSLVPDFSVHFDVENHIDSDIIYVSNIHVKELLLSHGFDENKIVITGLPVHPKFDNVERIRKDKPVILVSFGGNGLSYNVKVIKAIKDLLNDHIIIVLNGHNTKSYKKITKFAHPNLINMSFTNDVQRLIGMSDIVIGKIGGATTSECLQLKTPLIIPFPSYCQEEFNLKLLQKYNLVYRSNIRNLKSDILYLLKNKPDFKDVNKVHNFKSTEDLCNDIIKKFNKEEK